MCIRDRNTPAEHITQFYRKFSEVRTERFDGVIVTGAPVEHLPFEEVAYWSEMESIFDWIEASGSGMYSICWGAMASLYHFHKVPKHLTASKQFGVYHHSVREGHRLTEGIRDGVGIPVSRHTEWRSDDMANLPTGTEVLLESEQTGPCVVWDRTLRHCHVMNHFEYDADSLDQEYRRDLAQGTPTGEPIPVPANYYPQDDPSNDPGHGWHDPGVRFFNNWLQTLIEPCLLYTSDAADEEDSVDLGGRRIIKKKKNEKYKSDNTYESKQRASTL
eukprot:TRINITY_DN6157_c0_g1_i6.p1 TRINITY_DN6157_c0_g1~~TRINITY_DN6157_c0_g1_i6.p1  ORF type:complete len:274 (+),score=54.09 TRINITY_DN6157_c0_g1_i6:169-990(+)